MNDDAARVDEAIAYQSFRLRVRAVQWGHLNDVLQRICPVNVPADPVHRNAFGRLGDALEGRLGPTAVVSHAMDRLPRDISPVHMAVEAINVEAHWYLVGLSEQ